MAGRIGGIRWFIYTPVFTVSYLVSCERDRMSEVNKRKLPNNCLLAMEVVSVALIFVFRFVFPGLNNGS